MRRRAIGPVGRRDETRLEDLNRLTAIRLRHYSDGMISDFELLAQKVSELADLAHALRRENAELRSHAATLDEENGELQRRMQVAHDRVSTLLARLPEPAAAAPADADLMTAQQEPA